MVAPSRTPQARGVKCALCKKILAQATWLDQTKLAKHVDEAQQVLELINQHSITNCPCIPRNIETLLVGSTHFEIHRLLLKNLNLQVHKRQQEFLNEERVKRTNESRRQNQPINDCQDNLKKSKFKLYSGYNERKKCDTPNQMLRQLCKAIDSWKMAMEDQSDPFNAKLALRLGLTHHVIYACYLFKFHKLLDYQIIAANLLVDLFKSIDGVTPNAQIHSYFVLVRALMDCNQLQLAKQILKIACKTLNYEDKSHYESILLACVECELNLLLKGDSTALEELARLAVFRKDDKLQHYYSRTLAITVVIRYIHLFEGRSRLCFEFYHAFRYICAMIRRCHESSFALLSTESGMKGKQQELVTSKIPINHSWIEYAVSDFVFNTFELLTNFYIKAGIPEYLETLYNGLSVISYKTCSYYWQFRMAAIGIDLDVLCDKHDDARGKLNVMSRILGHTNDALLMNLLRLELDYSSIVIQHAQKSDQMVKKEVLLDLIHRISSYHYKYMRKIAKLELFDCKSRACLKLSSPEEPNDHHMMLDRPLRQLSLQVILMTVTLMAQTQETERIRGFMNSLSQQFDTHNYKALEFYHLQTILDTLTITARLSESQQQLLDSAMISNLFLKPFSVATSKTSLEAQLSAMTLNSDNNSGNNLCKYDKTARYLDILDAVRNFDSLTREEIVLCYLRNSEPNPDYLKYRQSHELMFTFRLRDKNLDRAQLLYHFCESVGASSMRYRWMMFEEQQRSIYDDSNQDVNKSKQSTDSIIIGFDGVLVDIEPQIKLMIQSIPEASSVLQVKYIGEAEKEHLILMSLDTNGEEPVYVLVSRPIESDQFFDCDSHEELSEDANQLPSKLAIKIEESRRSLHIAALRTRNEKRQVIERDLGVLLHDLEHELLGSFRWLLCGEILNSRYNDLVRKICLKITKAMKPRRCLSPRALRMVIENASLLNRDEICELLAVLFGFDQINDQIRASYANDWLKALEAFVSKAGENLNKTSYLQSLQRGQLCLVLDERLGSIPFESLPLVRILSQPIHRLPSLRILHVLSASLETNKHPETLDPTSVAYVLDPASNLSKTRDRFEAKLRAKLSWVGVVGEAPTPDNLESWLLSKHLYLFIGHGAGMTYYNSLCKQKGLSAVSRVRCSSVVMGCSSGRVQSQGPRLESFGVSWTFILKGAPSYLGLLWDVTDTDIDRFLDTLLDKLLVDDGEQLAITDATAKARLVCQSKFLIGSAPVVYGLPVTFSSKTNTRRSE